MLFEFKPDKGNGPGVLSLLRILDDRGGVIYEPRKNVKTEAALIEELRVLMLDAPWLSEGILVGLNHALGDNVPETVIQHHIKNVDVYAFVTGSIREKYYRLFSDRAKQAIMNTAVMRVLSAVGAKPFSQIFQKHADVVFLSEIEEGKMELLGQRRMYTQINMKWKELNGQTEKLEALVSLGIGQTSVQWAACTQSAGGCHVFPYANGMNNASRLSGFGKALVAHYEELKPAEIGSLDSFVDVIRRCLSSGGTPVIGLKSGASMYLTSSAGEDLRRELAEGPTSYHLTSTPTSSIRVFFVFSGQRRAAILCKNITMSRLYSDAKQLFGISQNFRSALIHNKPILSMEVLEPDDEIQFHVDNAAGTWWPDAEHSALCIRLPISVVPDFEAPSSPEQQFRHILTQYLGITSHEASSYECIAHVTRLLWDPAITQLDFAESQSRAKVLLEVAEQWFREILDTVSSPKLEEFKNLQQVSPMVKRSISSHCMSYMFQGKPLLTGKELPDEVALSVLDDGITLQRLPYHLWMIDDPLVTNETIDTVVQQLTTSTATATVIYKSSEKSSKFIGIVVQMSSGEHYNIVIMNQDATISVTALAMAFPVNDTERCEKSTYVLVHQKVPIENVHKKRDWFHADLTNAKMNTNPGESRHTYILRKLQEKLGTIEYVYYVQQRSTLICIVGEHYDYVISIRVDSKSFQKDELSTDFKALIRKSIIGMDSITPQEHVIDNTLLLDLMPYFPEHKTDDDSEAQQCDSVTHGIVMHDLRRVVQAINANRSLEVVYCEDRINMEPFLGERYVATLIVAYYKNTRTNIPVFHRVQVCVQSQLEPLFEMVHVCQRNGKEQQPYQNNSWWKKAESFFPTSRKMHPNALSQGPGNWIRFHRRAHVLSDAFKRAMEQSAYVMQSRKLNVQVKTNEKSERSLQRKMRADGGLYINQVIPLSAVEEKYYFIHQEWDRLLDKKPTDRNQEQQEEEPEEVSDDNSGSQEAFKTTLHFLSRLWNISDDPKWLNVRGKLKIGWIKETREYGNTSVSMGAASKTTVDVDKIGFLNCGTGGIKYQIFSKMPCLHMLKVHRGKCNVNQLTCGDYIPTQNEMALGEARTFLQSESKEQGLRDMPIYAFITGPIRDAWASATPENKEKMETRMANFFKPINALPLPHVKSFFITQQQEAELELEAVQSMYDNLKANKKLQEDVNIIACFGIGRASSRWICNHPTGVMANVNVIAQQCGMDVKRDRLEEEVADVIIENLLADDKAHLYRLIDVVETHNQPLLALKSGCTLLLQRNPTLKDALLSPASFIYDYLRGTFFLEQNTITPLMTEMREILRVLYNHVGPIVRIKDQSKLGFIIVNVLFWHAVEDRGTQSETKSAPVVVHTGP